jgi:hypothetical protein
LCRAYNPGMAKAQVDKAAEPFFDALRVVFVGLFGG